MKQEEIMQFQMLSNELEQVQNFLTEIENKTGEVANLINALETFSTLETGKETVFPLASGIFAEGTLTNNKELLINVGQGVVVRRSVSDAIGMIQQQMEGLQQQQSMAATKQQELYEQLQSLEKKVSTELEKGENK